ncbi:MAG: response regulator [Myxococcota bacterium]|nr:response regulator [Myxococcota bacterium]
MATANLKIPGLDVQSMVGQGAHSIVYRAVRDGIDYAVKVPRTEELDSEERRGAFVREAAIVAQVKHEALPRVFEVGEVDECPYLVMEFMHGSVLASELGDEPLSQERVCSIALDIVRALSMLHMANIVHRDVKPRNVIMTGEGRARLIDYGISGVVDTQNELMVAGTFQYAAPEQTGMLERPVDGRADLYALGVLMFECLTGRLPFIAREVGEMLRMHAVMQAPDVRSLRADVTDAMALVIARLLAKDPDDRYESADSLATDLENIEYLDQQLADSGDVVLDSMDARLRAVHGVLVGRDGELKSLRNHWEKGHLGQGGVCLIEGASGTGRTHLMHRHLRELSEQGVPVLVTRCSDEDQVPMGSFRRAIDGFIHGQVMGSTKASLAMRKRVEGAIGDRLPALASFSREVAAVFRTDERPTSEQDLISEEEAVVSFLFNLASSGPGASLFIDELQWCDDGSWEILSRLLRRMRGTGLVIYLSLRDGEASNAASSKLRALVGGNFFFRITLGDLSQGQIESFLNHQLGTTQYPRELPQQVFNRTEGRPMAVTECVRAMFNQGVILPHWGGWRFDKDGISRLKLPDNVLDISLDRLRDISGESLAVLRQAAVIGSHFDMDLLAALYAEEPSRVYHAVAEASNARIIDYTEDRDHYAFIHSRVRNALQEQQSERAIRDCHQNIAEALESMEEGRPGRVYALAEHYALGDADNNPKRVYETNRQAGRLAVIHNASSTALTYFETARVYLTRSGSEIVAERAELARWMGEACSRTHRLREAQEHFREALSGIKDPLTRARVLIQVSELEGSRYQFDTARSHIKQAFTELGVSVPEGSPLGLATNLIRWGWSVLKARLGFKHKPLEKKEVGRLKILAELLDRISKLAYYEFKPKLLLEGVIREVLATEKIGPSLEQVKAFTAMASAFAVLGFRRAADHFNERAGSVADELDLPSLRARTSLSLTLTRAFLGDVRASQAESERLRRFATLLDPWMLNATHVVRAYHFILQGRGTESVQSVNEGRLQLRQMGQSEDTDPEFFHVFDLFEAQAGALLGQHKEAVEIAREGIGRTREISPRDRYSLCRIYSAAVFCLAETMSEDRKLVGCIDAFTSIATQPKRVPYYLRSFYVSHAYYRLRLYEGATRDNRTVLEAQLREALRLLEEATKGAIFRCHYFAILGGMHRVMGESKKCFEALRQAEDLAHEANSPWALYEAARQRAHALWAEGNTSGALLASQSALSICIDGGWSARVKKLRIEFPQLSGGQTVVPTQMMDTSTVGTWRFQQQLDVIMQVGMASSRVLDPSEQVRVVLDETVRLLNAERGFLFVTDESNELVFSVGRGRGETEIEEPEKYSRRVIKQVARSFSTVVVTGTGKGPVAISDSILAHDLRSIMAAPLILQDRLLGVVYLDNRTAKGVFTEKDGEVLSIIGSFLAVSQETARSVQGELQRRELEAKARDLELSRNLAESASEMKSSFLANMSHEIRTPMNGVLGMSELLRQTELQPEQKDYVATIDSCAKSLLRIINDILDISKIEAGKLEIEEIPMSLRMAVEEVAELTSARADEKGVEVIVDFGPSAPDLILGDPGRVRQIITNLVGNAIKFTEQGHVGIVVRGEELDTGRSTVEIGVTDTGIGIPADKLDHIFDDFSQASEDTTRQFGGTGLGLSISRELCRLMGGRITVASTVGEGSVFTVSIPFTLSQTKPDEYEEIVIPERLNGAKVLIAARDTATSEALLRLVQSIGCQGVLLESKPILVANYLNESRERGERCLAAIFEDGPGQVRGIEMLAKDPRSERTPLVALVGSTRQKERKRLVKAGARDMVSKPVRAARLVRVLDACFEQPKAVSQVEKRSGSAAAAESEARSLQVLVVDDNVVNQKLAAKILQKMGHHVDIVENGQLGVDKVKAGHYDIVFMDCQMPVLDGYAAVGAIREYEAGGTRLPVVAMTANAMKGDREKCLAAGMDDYITKPFKPKDFKQAVATWVTGQEGEEPTAPAESKVEKVSESKNVSASEECEALMVLVVDDNIVNQKLAAKILQKLGHKVDVVKNGREAVESVGSQGYDIVFMDCQMPEMDGYTATRTIRGSEGDAQRLPIVAMTANAMKGDRENCLAAGMDDYITKPFKSADFEKAIETWVEADRG